MIYAIIVDAEPKSCQELATDLNKYCPDVYVFATCHNGTEALACIQKQPPDLLFLNVELPDMDGFQLLDHIKNITFDVIFITKCNQYAQKAIRYNAIDYLLKPFGNEELQKAVERVGSHRKDIVTAQLDLLLHKIYYPYSKLVKIALPTLEGFQMVMVEDIVTCHSDRNYTICFLKKNQRLMVSRTLKEIEELLDGYPFIRVHHSFIVNVNEINKYVKGIGGFILMSDGTKIDVSRSRKEFLIKTLLHKM